MACALGRVVDSATRMRGRINLLIVTVVGFRRQIGKKVSTATYADGAVLRYVHHTVPYALPYSRCTYGTYCTGTTVYAVSNGVASRTYVRRTVRHGTVPYRIDHRRVCRGWGHRRPESCWVRWRRVVNIIESSQINRR